MASALLYWGMDLIPFIPAAMPDWLPVCLNMAELSSRNFPSMFHPLLTISHEEIALSVVKVKVRSEEHTSELQSRFDLVCRLLLEKKKTRDRTDQYILNTRHRYGNE